MKILPSLAMEPAGSAGAFGEMTHPAGDGDRPF
jgi:hypothetical protein